jgi:hypothetical protein
MMCLYDMRDLISQKLYNCASALCPSSIATISILLDLKNKILKVK